MLHNTFIEIINEQSVKDILRTTRTKPIVDAIKNRQKITFDYYGPRKPKKDSVKWGKRVNVEPYAIGLNKKGKLVLRAWVDTPSASKTGFAKNNWRTFIMLRMKNVIITDNIFNPNRPGYKEGNDGSMSVTYFSLDKSTTPKPPKREKKVAPTKEKEPTKVIPTKKELPQPKQEPIKKELPKLKPEPLKKELPQPKPEIKPEPIKKEPVKNIVPKIEPEKPEELPQPKSKVKPEPIKEPEVKPEDENNKLQETLKKIKSLMFG